MGNKIDFYWGWLWVADETGWQWDAKEMGKGVPGIGSC